MKRILGLVLTFIISFSVSACGKDINEQSSDASFTSDEVVLEREKQVIDYAEEQQQAETESESKETINDGDEMQGQIVAESSNSEEAAVMHKANTESENDNNITLESQAESASELTMVEESNNAIHIQITIQDKTFFATLYDSETTKAFVEQLPMTINMKELNGNEKYYYLPVSLPTNSYNPSSIHAGDLMLYGSECLVIFYDSFSTSYSYTRIGSIDNPDNLVDAVGSGDVQMTFNYIY